MFLFVFVFVGMGDWRTGEDAILEAYLLADRPAFTAALEACLDRARDAEHGAESDAALIWQQRMDGLLFGAGRPDPSPGRMAWAIAEIMREVERRRVELYEPLLGRLLDARAAAAALDAAADRAPPPYECCFLSVAAAADARRVFVPLRTRNSFEHVGMRVWAAGLLLANFLAANPSLLRGARVLELGAGIGATAAALAAAMDAADAPLELVLTDYEPSVVDNMRHNVAGCGWPVVRCETLDWCRPLAADVAAYDLVVAADVTYDPALAPPFAATLAALLALGGRGILCSTLRNPATFATFRTALDAVGVDLADILFNGPFPVRPAVESAPVLLHWLKLR